ncbi:hypothetical protein WCX49_01915 [Sulfurimonas sp. HSL-1656]|uniref:hypothetical protein n=1 Tax=Thiomicrolovo subterrani TaxID=3131934 RepID=UPI0031F8C52C
MKKLHSAIIATAALLAVLSGCGQVEDTQTQDNNTIDLPTTPANNCPAGSYSENDFGCYDSSALFPSATGETVVEDMWSVYSQSNTNRTDGVVFYDRYQFGYQFSALGYAFQQNASDDYTYYGEWGVASSGNPLNVGNYNGILHQYTATGQGFQGQPNCYEVTDDGTTLKLCHETLQNEGATLGSTGYYYGATVKFGNLLNYNFTVVGTWTISGYDANPAPEMTVYFSDNGTISTGSGGEWGVSADGKVIEIAGVRYLVFQYLDDPDVNCIATLELAGGTATSTLWKMCKQ